MQTFKALIFDFNGVLLLDQHIHDAIWSSYAEKIRGEKLQEDEVKAIFHGRTNRGVLEYLYGRELETSELAEWAKEKELLYQEAAKNLGSQYQLAPGAVELFSALREHNTPFTIATSSPKMNVDFFNDELHLDTWFDMGKIAFDDGVLRGKPAPDLYLRAAQLLSLKPEECVVVEDASSGIAAAHAAGIGHIIAIGPKDSHDRLEKLPGVSEVVERLDQIEVERLF